jgi:hypothetical protein
LAAASRTDETTERPAAGDAAAASAAIEAWLARRAAAGEPDWQGCLTQMRSALEQLGRSRLIHNDPQSQAIWANLVAAPDMEEFAAEIDQLALRVAELTGMPASGRRAPVVSLAQFELHAGARRAGASEPEPDAGRTRMVLKL